MKGFAAETVTVIVNKHDLLNVCVSKLQDDHKLLYKVYWHFNSNHIATYIAFTMKLKSIKVVTYIRLYGCKNIWLF